MEENALEDIIKATQSLNDLVMNTEPDLDEIIEDNNDEINLEVDYPYIIFYRSDLVRAMNLCNKIVQPKSNTTTYKGGSSDIIVQDEVDIDNALTGILEVYD